MSSTGNTVRATASRVSGFGMLGFGILGFGILGVEMSMSKRGGDRVGHLGVDPGGAPGVARGDGWGSLGGVR